MSLTKRIPMNNITKGTINWNRALDVLSHGAFYMLATMKYKSMHISDETLKAATGIGTSTLRKHKKELIDTGFMTSTQIGRAKYHYIIGDVNG